MSTEPSLQTAPLEASPLRLAWSARDSWLGVGLVAISVAGAALIVAATGDAASNDGALASYSKYVQAAVATVVEAAYAIPALVILTWRRAEWRELGFRRYKGSDLGLGCALLMLTYMALMVYGAFLAMLHIQTQGDMLLGIMTGSKWPLGLAVPVIIAAPLAEEIFFRGFLFQGLRQQLGWNRAALISSSIFAILHLQFVALIPTFLLGYLFCYVYHRSNSIWPGIILHFVVNSFAFCILFAAAQLAHL